jgi:uncharacterized protein (TIGR03083 family)
MSGRTDTIEILGSALASFGDTVRGLAPDQWGAQSLCPAWTVRDVVLHVTSVEAALLGWRPGGEHPFAGLGTIVEDLTGLDDAALLARFDELAAARLAELATMTDAEFDAPSVTPAGPGTYGRFMRIRVFDIWVHERDIRVALDLPGDDGGPAAELALDEAQSAIGYIVGKKVGMPDGTSIAIQLTGPVVRRMCAQVDGRAKEVDRIDEPTVTVTTDSLTFMLLAGGRIDPEGPIADGRITWTGDAVLGDRASRNFAFTM